MSPFCFSDTNEDNFLDEQELEALFTKEVRNPEEPGGTCRAHQLSSVFSFYFVFQNFVDVFHI